MSSAAYDAQATAAPVQATPVVVQTQAQPQDPRLIGKGVSPGGVYSNESYCGPMSLVIGFLIFPCICCCPIDKRDVYQEPATGRKIVL